MKSMAGCWSFELSIDFILASELTACSSFKYVIIRSISRPLKMLGVF